ncbi:MAG: hypothetical protein IKU45_05045 [Clostridia bacterium]|nr:hypothetical protein [Clostridia bacterium]
MKCIAEEIKQYTDEFLYQIKRCEDYYGAYEMLDNVYHEYNKGICIAKDFFSVTREALLNSMMMELIKLYDKHKDAITIKKFFDKCSSSPDYCKFFRENEKIGNYNEIIKSFDDFLTEATTITTLKNLIARRDGYYMHNDGQNNRGISSGSDEESENNKKYFFCLDSLVEKYPFSFDEVKNLLSEAKSFCLALYKLVTDEDWSPSIHQGHRLEHIMDFSGLQKLLAAVKLD